MNLDICQISGWRQGWPYYMVNGPWVVILHKDEIAG